MKWLDWHWPFFEDECQLMFLAVVKTIDSTVKSLKRVILSRPLCFIESKLFWKLGFGWINRSRSLKRIFLSSKALFGHVQLFSAWFRIHSIARVTLWVRYQRLITGGVVEAWSKLCYNNTGWCSQSSYFLIASAFNTFVAHIDGPPIWIRD